MNIFLCSLKQTIEAYAFYWRTSLRFLARAVRPEKGRALWTGWQQDPYLYWEVFAKSLSHLDLWYRVGWISSFYQVTADDLLYLDCPHVSRTESSGIIAESSRYQLHCEHIFIELHAHQDLKLTLEQQHCCLYATFSRRQGDRQQRWWCSSKWRGFNANECYAVDAFIFLPFQLLVPDFCSSMG